MIIQSNIRQTTSRKNDALTSRSFNVRIYCFPVYTHTHTPFIFCFNLSFRQCDFPHEPDVAMLTRNGTCGKQLSKY